MKAYNEAIRYKPDFAYAYFGKGVVFANTGRDNKAVREYDKALRYNPQYDAALYNKALALSRLGRQKEAGEVYAKLWDDKTIAEYKKEMKEAH